MRISDSVKAVLAWIGLIAIIPASITAFEATGYLRPLAGFGVIVLMSLVWNWRRLLNYVRRIETAHSVYIVNKRGDADYTRETTLLPLLWPVRTSEVFVSLSSEAGWIESVNANCDVEWSKKEEKVWHGTARTINHRGKLLAFGKPAGTRIELVSKWRSAFVQPSHDFVVACPERGSSRIVIRIRWRDGCQPLEAFAQSAAYPTSLVRQEHMIDTKKLPWRADDCVHVEVQPDGSHLIEYKIDLPRRCYMYRVFWRASDADRKEVYMASES